MQEIVIEPIVAPARGNLAALPRRNAQRHPDRVAFGRRRDGRWQDVTSAEFAAEVHAVAKGLMAAGVEPGDRIALMSRTRYEWTLLDFAVWAAGAVGVPVYETSSASQVEWILGDSGARAIFVESADHLDTVTRVRDDLPDLGHVWHVEAGAVDELATAGREITDEELEARSGLAGPDDIATIIYTSGTTGRPRGCRIMHRNFLDLSANIGAHLPELVHRPDAATLLFLPLAHVFARLIQVTAVDHGVRVGHSPDVKNLLPDLESFGPTFLLAVPRVFEKIYNATDQKLSASGKGRIFRLAARTAIAYSRALDTGGPSWPLTAQHRLFDLLVYRRMRAAMGGRIEWAVSGGASLGDRLGHFFRGIGVVVLEGYGLTETTAPLSVGRPAALKVGTVGRPLPGVGIRIAEDGEILTNGIGVFAGYLGNEEATLEAFTDDGWLRAGDLGELDDEGFLTVTGRKKEIIVTQGGKNVSPGQLEDVVRAHPLVSQCVVVGDGRPYIAALVTIDEEMVGSWGETHDLPGLTGEDARTNDVVRSHLQKAVDRANQTVSRAESIRDFDILPGDFTEQNGYLTPSLKVKRNLVCSDFADDIDALYERGAARRRAEKSEQSAR